MAGRAKKDNAGRIASKRTRPGSLGRGRTPRPITYTPGDFAKDGCANMQRGLRLCILGYPCAVVDDSCVACAWFESHVLPLVNQRVPDRGLQAKRQAARDEYNRSNT